ncbi:MAG TPA: cbb3-type cytochrome c oxidase subunit I, partial [Candidatus Limnocylindria bacterium]
PPRVRGPLIPSRPDSAATGFIVLGALWLVVAAGLGAIWVLMLIFPDQLKFAMEFELPIIGKLGIDFSASTVSSGFMNALVFGWLSNASFAAILFITPRLTGTRLVGEPVAWGAMALWNLGAASGLAGIYIPQIAGHGPLAEFPLPSDGLLLLAMLIVNAAFWRTLLASRQRLPYVSIWFFGVALLASMGAYALGAAAQAGATFINLDETTVALIYAFVARALFTYWILGVTLGTLFYVVPRATLNALASGGLALASWVLWAALAGLSAIGALVDPSVPYLITQVGNVGTMLLVAPVFLALTTLGMTLRGRWSLMLSAGTVSFAVIAMAFLVGSTLLDAIGALHSVQGLVRNTEWAAGAALFGTLGAATFAFYAFSEMATPRMFRRDWSGTLLTDGQQWATFAGTAVAGLALIGAGIAHGTLMAQGAPGDQVSGTLIWFRLVAAGGLGLAALGGICLVGTHFLMYTTARRAEYAMADAVPAAGH